MPMPYKVIDIFSSNGSINFSDTRRKNVRIFSSIALGFRDRQSGDEGGIYQAAMLFFFVTY